MRSVFRRHADQPLLLVPARRVGDRHRVACTACRSVHVHQLNARSPRCFADGSLAARFGRIVVLTDAESDAELLQVADQFWLLFGGWRITADQERWRHFLLGEHSTPDAIELQRQLDAVHAPKLRAAAEARC